MRSQIVFIFIIGFFLSAQAKTVHYELTVTKTPMNMSGKKTVDFALAVNGSIPSPTLEFTEGDDAEIVVKNRIPDDEVSIHWHGILLPNEMDGVPYVTTPPIFPGQDFTFKFKIRQHGTYWYHSHTNVQEQKGVYGAFIIHPKKKTVSYDKDVAVVLSDWSDENATQILKNLRKDGDYYLFKKGTMRSWLGALQEGALGVYLSNEWQRMGGMDYSDVGYDAFLINGKNNLQLLNAHKGEKVRLRIINAAASTYFYIALGQKTMKVISADGVDMEPVYVKEILSGMAETHDVLFELPEQKNYELKITAQDGTGSASGWIGQDEKVFAPVKSMPPMYESMDGHHDHHKMDHSIDHDHHGGHHAKTIETLTVDEMKAQDKTEFSKSRPVRELKLVLGGDMERYVWHINGQTISEDRTIEVKEGDVIRFVFENQTMMHHPMHLHGHFFRVLNKNGEYSPLKHTVDVPPHGSRTIEFLANEPGEWMLHCHNLYHLKNGMARVVSYMSYKPKDEMSQHRKHDPHMHEHWYFYGKGFFTTNLVQEYFRFSQTRNQFESRIESKNLSKKSFSFESGWESEGDLFYRRWVDQYFNFILGGTSFEKELSAVAGVGYKLPLLIETNLLVNHKAKFRLDLEKKFQWSKNIFTKAGLIWREHDFDYDISLMYSDSWSWAFGISLTQHSLGAGLQVQF